MRLLHGIEGWYIYAAKSANGFIKMILRIVACMPSIPMADICDDFVFPFHWGYHFCSFIHTFSCPFFFNKYFVLCWNCIFVYTCDAGVLKVIIFSNVRVLFCDFYYAPGIGSLVYSILKNGPLHPFLTFSNSETKNKFLTFFGEKIGRGNSKSLTW